MAISFVEGAMKVQREWSQKERINKLHPREKILRAMIIGFLSGLQGRMNSKDDIETLREFEQSIDDMNFNYEPVILLVRELLKMDIPQSYKMLGMSIVVKIRKIDLIKTKNMGSF